MREILFRGKRKDNGEWVEGNLFVPDRADTPTQICMGTNTVRIAYDVDHSTVGQYTGLTDKNGKKIFEGDLCLCNRHINDRFDKTVFEIVFDKERGFYGENFNEIESTEFYMCEVIGNVHDNPELLKVGANK